MGDSICDACIVCTNEMPIETLEKKGTRNRIAFGTFSGAGSLYESRGLCTQNER